MEAVYLFFWLGRLVPNCRHCLQMVPHVVLSEISASKRVQPCLGFWGRHCWAEVAFFFSYLLSGEGGNMNFKLLKCRSLLLRYIILKMPKIEMVLRHLKALLENFMGKNIHLRINFLTIKIIKLFF